VTALVRGFGCFCAMIGFFIFWSIGIWKRYFYNKLLQCLTGYSHFFPNDYEVGVGT